MNAVNALTLAFVFIAAVMATVNAGREEDILDFCDLCDSDQNELACLICKRAMQNNQASLEYGDIEKRGFLRQTRLFPCQCCLFSRHQNTYCCDQCYKK